MGLFDSLSNTPQQSNEQGQKDGSQASWLERYAHGLVPDDKSDDPYKAGYQNGLDNPASDDSDDD